METLGVQVTSTPVEWPHHWRSVPLWTLFERVKDVGHPDEELLSVYRDYGVIPKNSRDDNMNKTALDRNIYQLVDSGWFVVNRMKAWQGSVGISFQRGIVSGHYLCFRPRHNEDPRFLNWLLRSYPYTVEYARMSRGVRPNQIEIDNDSLRALSVRLPPLDEQRRIADFLDEEVPRINRVVSLRKRHLEVLHQRELAILDSSIEEYIQRFGTLPFRRYIERMDQGSSPQCDASPADEDEWGVLKVSSIRPGEFLPNENKRLPRNVDHDEDHEVRQGDLLICRANTPELVGATTVVPTVRRRLLLSDKIFRVRLTGQTLPEYIATVARGSRIRSLCSISSHGASQSMANIRFEEVKKWPIPCADLRAQEELASRSQRLRGETARIAGAINHQIELLTERKHALITAAVTGQIDVTTARGADLS